MGRLLPVAVLLLCASSPCSLATAYLDAQNTWALEDGAIDASSLTARDSAPATTNAYPVGNPRAGTSPANLSGGATWVTDAELGLWVHLVATHDPARDRNDLDLNGNVVGSSDHVASWTSTGPLTIGQGGGSGYFSGRLSDVRAWDHALSLYQTWALVDGLR